MLDERLESDEGVKPSVCHCGCPNERGSIFERSVQDPFCSTFYNDDQEPLEIHSRAEDSLYELNPLQEETLYYKIPSDNEEEFQEVELGGNPFRSNMMRGDTSLKGKIGSPSKCGCVVCSNCHGLRKPRSKSSASYNGYSFSLDSNPVSRTNSIVIPLSKQPTRQSIASSVGCLDTNNTINNNSLSFGSPTNITDEGAIDPKSSNGSRSSISLSTNAIPTHLYSLERYVSSELDSATESFFDKSKQLSDEASTHGTEDTVSSSLAKMSLRTSPQSSNSTIANPNTYTNRTIPEIPSGTQSINQYSSSHPPPFLDARKRRKSFIEQALSESFS